MFNKLTIYTDRVHTGADYFISDISNIRELLINHLDLNAEDYLLTIKELFLALRPLVNPNSNVLTIGIDVLKDIALSQLLQIKFDCYDINIEFISRSKKLSNKLCCDDYLNYENRDIRYFPISDHYDIGLLTQMDYIFDDYEFSNIIEKFNNSNIRYLILTSRSIYKISICDFYYDFIFNFLYSIKTKLLKGSSSYPTYRRSYSHFMNILDKNFLLTHQSTHKTNSGPIWFMVFQNRKM